MFKFINFYSSSEETETVPETETEDAEPEKPKKRKAGIVKFIRDGLQDGSFKGMKNKEIAELARGKFEGSKLQGSGIGWCKGKLKKEGLKIVT